MLFVLILGHFWCYVLTSVIFKSNFCNIEIIQKISKHPPKKTQEFKKKTLKNPKKNKNKKNLFQIQNTNYKIKIPKNIKKCQKKNLNLKKFLSFKNSKRFEKEKKSRKKEEEKTPFAF